MIPIDLLHFVPFVALLVLMLLIATLPPRGMGLARALAFRAAIAIPIALAGPGSAGRVLMATVFNDSGKAITANRLLGSGTEPHFVGWGTGAGTAAAADTTLFTESSETRATGTSSRVTTTVTNDTYQVVGTITATGTRAITNAGLFDAVTSGNIFMKGDFATINLSTGDSIQFTCQLKYS